MSRTKKESDYGFLGNRLNKIRREVRTYCNQCGDEILNNYHRCGHYTGRAEQPRDQRRKR